MCGEQAVGTKKCTHEGPGIQPAVHVPTQSQMFMQPEQLLAVSTPLAPIRFSSLQSMNRERIPFVIQSGIYGGFKGRWRPVRSGSSPVRV